MTTPYLESIRKNIVNLWKKSENVLESVYGVFIDNISVIIIFSILISIGFSIFKTLFVVGYPVDSYQYLAVAYEKWIKTGIKEALIDQHSGSKRFFFPLIIAITHIFVPIDISLLACLLNLIAALSCIYLFRKILLLNNFSQDTIDLSTLFIIFSYNFLNHWFTILTDVASLPFFMLMIYYLELYQKKNTEQFSKNFLLIGFSCFSFLIAFLTREIYIFSLPLYFVIISNRKLRTGVFLILSWFLFVLIDSDPSQLTFAEHFFTRVAWEEFKAGNYLEALNLLNQKWSSLDYLQGFVKGLIKVGIIPAILIIIIIFLFATNWRNLRSHLNKDKAINYSLLTLLKNKFTRRIPLILVWFLLYFVVYSVFYSNVYFPTGLRYWLPISWVLLPYVSKLITEKLTNYHLKVVIILFFCIYPVAWSSIELYENRNVQTGTGPIFLQNIYFNNMTDLRSITQYYSQYITIELENESFFRTTATPAAYKNESIEGHMLSTFSFFIWENTTTNLTIEVRLCTPNNAYWGFEIFEARWNYAPGHGRVRFAKQRIGASSLFQTYNYTTNQSFLARLVRLSVGGGENSTIIWDYLKIYVN